MATFWKYIFWQFGRENPPIPLSPLSPQMFCTRLDPPPPPQHINLKNDRLVKQSSPLQPHPQSPSPQMFYTRFSTPLPQGDWKLYAASEIFLKNSYLVLASTVSVKKSAPIFSGVSILLPVSYTKNRCLYPASFLNWIINKPKFWN